MHPSSVRRAAKTRRDSRERRSDAGSGLWNGIPTGRSPDRLVGLHAHVGYALADQIVVTSLQAPPQIQCAQPTLPLFGVFSLAN
eukprot:6186709-Pleurochrysis_carterae.AAC.4